MSDLLKIEEIYHAALERPAAERQEFLDRACEDETIRREVESLLAYDEKAASFIEQPPEDVAAGLFARSAQHELIGRSIGRYRVESLLGVGGMGEVFVAEDTKLKRRLALKVLPREFADDIERKRRFEREARAASALNHPNIITIYGTESVDGVDFIVSELIDGSTLRQRIVESPFEWREALAIVVQVADALDAAHKVGVIHRDIKPGNIMIRPDGFVKVLDFGLAKVMGRGDGESRFETRDLTGKNRVMGTISYMSPEQMLGEAVDERSDVYSLGIVLYEMLRGEPPFVGASDAAIYIAAVNEPPRPLIGAVPGMPNALEQIILHSLEKKPEGRYQSVADMRSDLAALASDASLKLSFSTPVQRKRKRGRYLAAGAAVLVLIVAAVAGYLNIRPAPLVRNYSYSQITKDPTEELYPRLLPDGSGLIYAGRTSGNWDIYLKKFGDSADVNLTKDSTADDRQPFLSSDGTRIVFRSERDGGGIFEMKIDGTGVRRIVGQGYSPVFSPDGKSVAFSDGDMEEQGPGILPSQLMIVDIATGETRIISTADAIQPSWSPNGKRIAVWGMRSGGRRDIVTFSADGGDEVAVTSDDEIDRNPVWAPDGKSLYFISDRSGSMNLWRIAIDQNTGFTSGQPEAITIPARYSQNFDFSKDGRSFAFVQSTFNTNIKSIEFDSTAEKLVGTPSDVLPGSRTATNLRISHDENLLFFDSVDDVSENLFVIRRDGGGLRQLTDDSSKNRAPALSPDGRHIAYFSDRSGLFQGYVMDAEGTNSRQVTNFKSDQGAQMPLWIDSRRVVFNAFNAWPIICDIAAPESEPVQIVRETPSIEWFIGSSLSGDGKRLVGFGRKPGEDTSSIYILDLETGKFGPPLLNGTRPVWLSDGRRFISFRDKASVYLYDNGSGRTRSLGDLPGDGLQSITISTDDRRVYYSVKRVESDIWLATEK